MCDCRRWSVPWRQSIWICLTLAVTAFSAGVSVAGPAPGAIVTEAPDSPEYEWTDILVEDFEGDFPGAAWHLGGDPTWGQEAYRPHSGTASGYCAGGGVYAVNPPGPYPDNMEAWMFYGPFDLSHAIAAELRFSYWTELPPTDDALIWGASRDGDHFTGRSAGGDSGGWQSANYDLADYLGEPEVWIAFVFESDATVAGEGAYIDDILLRAQLGPQEREFVYLPLIVGGRSALAAASRRAPH